MDSGLNSTVLASNNEMVILPINEPTFGTPRKSQIQARSSPHALPPSPQAQAQARAELHTSSEPTSAWRPSPPSAAHAWMSSVLG